MDIAAIAPVTSAGFVQPAFNTSAIGAASVAIQQAGVADRAAVSQSAPAAPVAARSVRDPLLSFLEHNLFRSLLTSSTLTANSVTSSRALTEILLQELIAAHNNQPRNPA